MFFEFILFSHCNLSEIIVYCESTNLSIMRWKMAASYKKLFKLLIDREMKSKELAAKAGISPATLAKMKKDGATVSSDVLVKICTALGCTMDDIVEIVPNNNRD